MSRYKKYLIGLCVILVLFLGYRYFSGTTLEYVAPEDVSLKNQKTVSENSSEEGVRTATSTVQAVSPLEKCQIAEKAKASSAKTNYEKGTLLVTFEKNISFESALETLAGYSLGYKMGPGIQTDFQKTHWLTVTVPKGEEFKWLCVLGDNVDIHYVGLNEIFNLHQ